MLKIKNLRGECQQCGGSIEFHAEHAGTTADCPHCGQPTELLLAVPPEVESPIRRKAIVFAVLAILILGGGLIATNIALKRAKRLQAERQAVPPAAPENPFAVQAFKVTPVKLEQGQGSSLVYASGTIYNTTNRQRFGVTVDVEIRAADGAKLGVASDYQKVIEPNAAWEFRALVRERRDAKSGATATITAIRETP